MTVMELSVVIVVASLPVVETEAVVEGPVVVMELASKMKVAVVETEVTVVEVALNRSEGISSENGDA